MNTRIATKSDIKKIREMWDNFYSFSGYFNDWFFNRAFYSQNSLVGLCDNELIASSAFIPHRMKIKNGEISSAYINGFVTLPEYKTENNTKELLADTLLMINDRDIPISFIVPHNYKFYEKYGFRTCYSFKQYNITIDDIPDFSIHGKIERSKISEKLISDLNTVYEKYTENKNGVIIRDSENWKLILEDLIGNFDGKIALLKDDENNPTGYILYVIRDGHFGVYEFAYTNRSSYESLMAYIKGHDTKVNRVTIKTCTDDLSYLDFCDNRTAAAVCPFAMVRINNVKKILEHFAKDFKGNVRLQVIDRLISDNNQNYAVSENEVIKIDTEYDVATDVGTLAMLCMGYISIDEAASLDLLSGDYKKLYGLFEKKNNYINMLCC